MLKKNGFTMLELLVVLVIMSMMITMSIPAFSSHIRGARMRTAAREISTAIMSARTQAITLREEKRVIFRGTYRDFGIQEEIGDDVEKWSLPPGVGFHGLPACTETGEIGITIILTPLGKVAGNPPYNITICNGEARKTIIVGSLGHVEIPRP